MVVKVKSMSWKHYEINSNVSNMMTKPFFVFLEFWRSILWWDVYSEQKCSVFGGMCNMPFFIFSGNRGVTRPQRLAPWDPYTVIYTCEPLSMWELAEIAARKAPAIARQPGEHRFSWKVRIMLVIRTLLWFSKWIIEHNLALCLLSIVCQFRMPL